MKTEYLAVMFTDIKEFTSTTSRKSREEIERLLDVHDSLIQPIFADFNGKIIKTIGDAFLVTFTSPTDAVLCGIKIQEILKEYNNADESEEPIQVRVAINAGEVNVRKGDVFGEPVNIAARIESIAEPGEIYFTESVYLSMNKREIPSSEIGLRHLKGIPNEIKVYKVLKEGEAAKPISTSKSLAKRKWKWWHIAIIAFVFLIILASLGDKEAREQNKQERLEQQLEKSREAEDRFRAEREARELAEHINEENPGNNNEMHEEPMNDEKPIFEEHPPEDDPHAKIEEWERKAHKAMENEDNELARKLVEKYFELEMNDMPPHIPLTAARLFQMLDEPHPMIEESWRAADMGHEDLGLWEEILRIAKDANSMFADDDPMKERAKELIILANEHLNR